LLWTSPILTTTWTTYCVTLHPAQSTDSLTFADTPLNSNSGDVALDHIVPVTACP
jgi:hypothetical protein